MKHSAMEPGTRMDNNTPARRVGAESTGDRFSLPVPVFPVGTPMVQAMLTTRRPRNVAQMASFANAFIVDAGPDASPVRSNRYVRMLAFYTPGEPVVGQEVSGNGTRRGTVILLHGWEGTSHAMMNLVLGTALVRAGYEVVRLNLRDHGPRRFMDPVGLNEGVFLATLLDEVRNAVTALAVAAVHQPVYLIGPSMGGNFALRLAASAGAATGMGLRHIIAVSPVLDPAQAVDRIDRQSVFRRYFRSRWLASLQRKSALFGQTYDFSAVEGFSRIRPMTEWLVQRYTEFPDADAYFEAYAFVGDASRGIAVPTTIVAAKDDPVIGVEDIFELAESPLLTRRVYDWGSHVGFISWPPLRHHLPDIILELLSAAD